MKEKIDVINSLNEYTKELKSQKESIETKISELEGRVLLLNNKESIVNNIIAQLNIELENCEPTRFKQISQLRTSLFRQFEGLSMISDMIIKSEDLIMKYRKMLIDLENSKITNIMKNDKEDEDSNAIKLLNELNGRIIQGINVINEDKNENLIMNDVLDDLKKEGYDV